MTLQREDARRLFKETYPDYQLYKIFYTSDIDVNNALLIGMRRDCLKNYIVKYTVSPVEYHTLSGCLCIHSLSPINESIFNSYNSALQYIKGIKAEFKKRWYPVIKNINHNDAVKIFRGLYGTLREEAEIYYRNSRVNPLAIIIEVGLSDPILSEKYIVTPILYNKEIKTITRLPDKEGNYAKVFGDLITAREYVKSLRNMFKDLYG